jgi:hypothetical protein
MLARVFNPRDVQVWAGQFDDWSHCTSTRHKIQHSLYWQRVYLNSHHQAIHTLRGFATNSVPQTVRQPSHQVKNKNCVFMEQVAYPAPYVEGVVFLSHPLHSKHSGSPFGTNSIEKATFLAFCFRRQTSHSDGMLRSD